MFTDLDRKLCRVLCDHPRRHNNRYTEEARRDLLEKLFRSLTNDRDDRFNALFPDQFPPSGKLQEAQSSQEGAEYTAAAKGHVCGHIFKPGEATYNCMTCTDDATCVLCARCFDASDHEGHQFHINISAGNNGCCDCGDHEAFKRQVQCAIHTATDDSMQQDLRVSHLPDDLQRSISTTIGRAIDYFCDVISCSPENLRLPKTEESVKFDESCSRLGEKWYSPGEEFEANPEYCLVLWNDEKHTVEGVQKQVARACRERESFGLARANEANDIGRSVIRHSRNIGELIGMCKILEQIKVTVTIRSSRDTFREQMCGTIVEWLSDIASCSIGDDHHILRQSICQEMLKEWRVGSEAYNATIGKGGIYDHEREEKELEEAEIRRQSRRLFAQVQIAQQIINADAFEEDDDPGATNEMEDGIIEEDEDEEDDEDEEQEFVDGRYFRASEDPDNMQVDADSANEGLDAAEDGDEMDTDGDLLDGDQPTAQNLPADQHLPPRHPENVIFTPTESEAGDSTLHLAERKMLTPTPKTPNAKAIPEHQLPPDHWRVIPPGYSFDSNDPRNGSDTSSNMRLDSMVLFDLRLWKKTRIQLRDLFISTVVNIAQFKRVLGLRFARLYTTLSQLYLVADREPDHSIIHLSLQMLTSPSITEEVIERGNFLTTLMAILYTFMTTRQVGFPKDVNPTATLAFDTGSVANRRLYHSFTDLRWILASEFVQRRVRSDQQYLLQYLDLAKLSQGICPNLRAVGEHVEYETDAWINASLLTKEMNKLCRQFAESYQEKADKRVSQTDSTFEAIFYTACATIVNSVGLERRRFNQNEIKELVRFKTMERFDFEINFDKFLWTRNYRVVDFVVQDSALSFHHALHYTLSWLIEFGKSSRRSIDALTDAARRFIQDVDKSALKDSFIVSDDALLAMFDYPLRVCAWLAQMKAGMWVRNGMSLKHQMVQYRSVLYRDVGHHRDLVLLQTALVSCDPGRVLASMIDRYGLEDWMRGKFGSPTWREDGQSVDMVEDFMFLLVNILSDRDNLIPLEDEPDPSMVAVRKDLIHTLCFKPLSFSELSQRLTERAQDHQQLQNVLDSMTNYRPPEGLHDSGIFELKPEFLKDLDPYNSNFNKNQRDEAEAIYRTYMAKTVGKAPEDIVLEPKLRPIRSGAYVQLAAVTRTPLFAQVIYYCLEYAIEAGVATPDIPTTRIEALLHVVLQLALIATLEDELDDNLSLEENTSSFVHHALNLGPRNPRAGRSAIITILQKISNMEEYDSCRGKIKHMLRLFFRKREQEFKQVTAHLEFPYGRLDTASPANVESEMEARKKQALERKAKVMAQFQQQQQTFMDNQGVIDWGEEDLSETEIHVPSSTQIRTWKYPSGVCIHCREETTDSRLYGTFAMTIESGVLRRTPLEDNDFVSEVLHAPTSLDQSPDGNRSFGVSGWNHEQTKRLNSSGDEIIIDRQGIGKGWPLNNIMMGPVMTSCGHIMHFSCFTNYYASVTRRQGHQISRNHPERTSQLEFVCPLCKAAGNTFLPIVWKGAEQNYPGPLRTEQSFDEFLESDWQHRVDVLHSQGGSAFSSDMTSRVHTDSLLDFMLNRPAHPQHQVTISDRAALKDRELGPHSELSNIYNRLRETLAVVRSGQLLETNSRRLADAENFDLLVESFADTVSVTEISYRGLASEFGMTLLSRIPQQTLTHLRVLASTVRLYAGVRSLRGPPISSVNYNTTDYKQLCLDLTHTLFACCFRDCPVNHSPLLSQDSFKFFAQASLVICPSLEIGKHHMLRLCYTAELLRVLMDYGSVPDTLGRLAEQKEGSVPNVQLESVPRDAAHGIMSALHWIKATSETYERKKPEFTNIGLLNLEPGLSPGNMAVMYKLLNVYALPFLRKAVILFHVAHGVDFPPVSPTESVSNELDRLTRLLNLPSISTIFNEFSEYSHNTHLQKIASGWLDLYYDTISSLTPTNEEARTCQGPPPLIPLLHPTPLELIGLPLHFDALMDLAHHHRCPTTARDLTDPAICLQCGAIFCAQAFCCMRDGKRGGCNRHLEETKCGGGTVGLFLFIRKCTVLLLHRSGGGSNGSWFHAPYLTRHGEHDQGLRTREQLVLSQKRYDKLYREAWLMVGGGANVWSMVSRKLEAEVNHGGWETL